MPPPLERIGTNGGSHPDMHEAPCDDLTDLRGRVGSIESRQAVFMATIDSRTGQMLQAAGEAAENSKNAARYAMRAADAAERVAARVYAPVNETLAKYHDSVPPTDIDAEMTEVTRVDIHSPSASLKRVREAEGKAAEVEQQLKVAKTKLYGALTGLLVPIGLALYAICKMKGWLP